MTTAQEFLRLSGRTRKPLRGIREVPGRRALRANWPAYRLPLSVYTEWYWKIDLHNLLHFLSLRMDAHAQQEIRDYANAMFALIQPIVPIAAEAFLDYQLDSLHLSRLEVEALRNGEPLKSENKRELAEFEEKLKLLGRKTLGRELTPGTVQVRTESARMQIASSYSTPLTEGARRPQFSSRNESRTLDFGAAPPMALGTGSAAGLRKPEMSRRRAVQSMQLSYFASSLSSVALASAIRS